MATKCLLKSTIFSEKHTLLVIHTFNGPFSGTTQVSQYQKETRSSAITEGQRDASCQLKSCLLPRNSAETTCTTGPEQIEVMKLEGYRGPMCNKHALNHDLIESLSLSYRCHKQTNYGPSCGYHLHTDDLLWQNFLSPQCRNCSHDPDHAPFREDFSSAR